MKKSSIPVVKAGTTRENQTNSNQDQSYSNQLAEIRRERNEQFLQIKANHSAQKISQVLKELQVFYSQYPMPNNKNDEIYASQSIHDRYITSLIEVEKLLDQVMKTWNELDLDEASRIVSSIKDLKLMSNDLSYERLVQLFKTISLLKEKVNLLVANHINDRNEERISLDKDIIRTTAIINQKLNEMLVSSNIDSSVAPAKPERVGTTPVDYQEADETVQDSLLLSLPFEIQVMIFNQLSVDDLFALNQTSNQFNQLIEAFLHSLSNPHYVIQYLSKLDGKTAHRFIAYYQSTEHYKELKRKVQAQEVMSDAEIICYTLTRDIRQLPEGIIKAMKSLSLDEATQKHLQMIVESSNAKDKKNFLLNFKNIHPHTFLNLLPGQDLFPYILSGLDLSFATLTHVKFAHPYDKTKMIGINLHAANLSHANLELCNLLDADLTNAILCKANLNSANLTRVKLDGAKLQGVDLTLAKIIDVDLTKVDLTHVNFEWTYLEKVRLVPEEAFVNNEAFEQFLNHFQSTIAGHTAGSQRNLQQQLLSDIADQLLNSTYLSKSYKIDRLKQVLSLYNQSTIPNAMIHFENPCLNLLNQLQGKNKLQAEPKEQHPLKVEAASLINSIMYKINNLPAAGKNDPRVNLSIKQELRSLYDCLAKAPELNDSVKICKAFGIDAYTWHVIYFLNHCESVLVWLEQEPKLLDYPLSSEDEIPKRFASEVFDGYLFKTENLQQIKEHQITSYLYGEEDFAITLGHRETNYVKLGDLFITYAYGGKGSVYSRVQVIDFENKKLKPCFNLDFERRSSMFFEQFLPINGFADAGDATQVGHHILQSDLPDFAAGYALKQKVIDRVFATQHGPKPLLVSDQAETQEELNGEKENIVPEEARVQVKSVDSHVHPVHKAPQTRIESTVSLGKSRHTLHGNPSQAQTGTKDTLPVSRRKKLPAPVVNPNHSGSCLIS